jgi:hypothetical protein
MDYADLISDYCAGPQKLRAAVAGMAAEQLDARPIPGKWSTKQVICHIADFEEYRAETATGDHASALSFGGAVLHGSVLCQ